jgi:metallo-beta-lactamase family protein
VKLHFLGANRQVTGSKYCLEVGRSRVLIDAGMFQERPFEHRNWEPFPILPEKITSALLTHAHLDHCGLLPRLVQQGLQCPIYCTPPTAPLTEVILRDSAAIQEEDLDYKTRRLARENRQPRYEPKPLYTENDVNQTIPLFLPTPYLKSTEVAPGVRATFHNAGHIMGSAMIEVVATEGDITRTILFSGDIGQWDKPIIKDPSLFEHADYVIMESTYGDKDHEKHGDVESQLADVVHETVARGGKLIIPTFALERAQELMYYFARLVQANRIPELPVYLDSPMAVNVTEIFARFRDNFDEETWTLLQQGTSPMKFPGLHMTRTANESRAINEVQGPCVIMASSGMCTAGRIKHHLRNHINKRENTVLFVGHQSSGTLGNYILQGAKEIRIHGNMVKVRAKIAQIYGFSGHADRSGLIRWLTSLKKTPICTYLTHGEEEVALNFANLLRTEYNQTIHVPQYNEVVDLD